MKSMSLVCFFVLGVMLEIYAADYYWLSKHSQTGSASLTQGSTQVFPSNYQLQPAINVK